MSVGERAGMCANKLQTLKQAHGVPPRNCSSNPAHAITCYPPNTQASTNPTAAHLEELDKLANLLLGRQDGGAQVEGALLLAKAGAGHSHDAGGLQQLRWGEGQGLVSGW